MNGHTATIVAVAPREFVGTSLDGSAEFWAPATLADVVWPPGSLDDRRNRRFAIYARLHEGIDRTGVEAWERPATGGSLTAGLLAPDGALRVTSELDGVVCGDGIEDDRLEVGWGQRVEISAARERLALVG